MEAADRLKFAIAAAESAHPLVRSWYDERDLVDNATAWLGGELRLVDDVEAAAEFQAAFPVPGVAAPAYANRVIRLDDGLDVVAGIRYRPSTKVFFVDLVATSRPIADAGELARVTQRLAALFAEFSPRWVRLFAADERLSESGRMVGDVVLAARVSDLRAAADESTVPDVAVRRVAASHVYKDYARLYGEFHAAAPGNEELSRVEDLETLERWEKDGGVFEIRGEGERAGYCGAKRWSRYGVRGWCGAEIILAPRFRRRGLASSVHRLLAHAIDAEPHEGLWAEVHEDNAPSLRAGIRAGYAVIGRVMRVPV